MNSLSLSFYQHLTFEDIEWIERSAQTHHLMADEGMVAQGEQLDALYFVMDGLLVVYVEKTDGSRQELALIGPGAVFGEISWLDGKPASAFVRARENSIVLNLPRAVLEEHLSTDLAFAARFYRSLATMNADRLRHADDVIRALTMPQTEAELSTGPASSLWKLVGDFKALLARADKVMLTGKHKIAKEEEQTVIQCFRRTSHEMNEFIHTLPASDHEKNMCGALMQKEFLPYILLTTTAERFYSKPRGYAGDYQTIDMIYKNQPSGQSRLGPLMDACFLSSPAAQAVRNRRHLLVSEIKQTIAAHPAARFASLACGPAQEVFDVFDESAVPEQVTVAAIDIDQQALDMVSVQARQRGLEGRIQTYKGNLIYLATGRQKLDLPPLDLVYSIGLIDYFNDKFVIKLLNWIHDRLTTGGRVILGNFHPRNPDRAFMDHILDWRLIHRDEDEMNRLFAQSSFGQNCTRIVFEEEGINLFAECKRTK